MRKGSVLACLVLGATLAATTGCQALYGGKPERPYSPRPKRPPPKPPETVVEFKPIDDCQASFHDPPIKGPNPAANTRQSQAAVQNAEAAMGQAAKAPDDSSKANYYKSAVESYRTALQKDPYNADVTLRLAVAYDSVYRKGCALALLRRIALMALNPKYQVGATHAQDDVEQNTTMFPKYHSDARRGGGPMKKLAAALLFVMACGGPKLTPPPPPLRPEPEPAAPVVDTTRSDCDPYESSPQLEAMKFDRRSIPESDRLSEEAKAKLHNADVSDLDAFTRESMITSAVDTLLTALKADPYNVDGTYVLAAAYAKMGRTQCSMNLLTRLLQMRGHKSKSVDVEAHLDKLLGRKQPLDPDFATMRGDDRFRGLIARMCEGTNDPNCVYGH